MKINLKKLSMESAPDADKVAMIARHSDECHQIVNVILDLHKDVLMKMDMDEKCKQSKAAFERILDEVFVPKLEEEDPTGCRCLQLALAASVYRYFLGQLINDEMAQIAGQLIMNMVADEDATNAQDKGTIQ